MKTADLYKILIDKHDSLLNKIEEDFKGQPVLDELLEDLIFYDFISLEEYKSYALDVQGKIKEVMKLNYNEDIVDSLISVKINRIIRHEDNLSESTLPTTLNMISLIFDKVLDDFKRHLLMTNDITPVKLEMVKWLKDETDCGMMDCKKALENNDWNIIKAKEYLENKEDDLCTLTTRRKREVRES